MTSHTSQGDLNSETQIPEANEVKFPSTSLQNGRTTQLNYRRLMKIDNCLLRILYCNFGILVIYYEFDYNNKDGLYNKSVNVLLWGLVVCGILGVIMLYFREHTKLELDVYQKKEFRRHWSYKRILKLIFQIILQIIQPYPWLNNVTFTTTNYKQKIQFPFKINYLLVIFALLKIYQIWKIFISSSTYATPRCNRLAKMYMSQANHTFALKCMFSDFPMKLVTICFFISICIFSFALRVAERSQQFTDKIADFNYLSNAVWLTVITLTTVGYGDVAPKTTIGRAIDQVLVLWGALIVSIMVAVLNNIFSMDQRQLKVLSLIKKLEKKKQIRVAAANFIQHFWRKNKSQSMMRQSQRLQNTRVQQTQQSLNSLTYKRPQYTIKNKQMDQDQYLRKYQKNSKTLFTLIKEAGAICEQDDVYEDMAREFQCLEDDLKSLNANQEKLTDVIHDKIQQKNQKGD